MNGPAPTLAALASVPEPSDCCCEVSPPEFGGPIPDRDCPIHGTPEHSDSEPAPCRCHNTHAAITPRHEGHCCFYPADRKCHPAEVEAWAAAHRALTDSEPAPDDRP